MAAPPPQPRAATGGGIMGCRRGREGIRIRSRRPFFIYQSKILYISNQFGNFLYMNDWR